MLIQVIFDFSYSASAIVSDRETSFPEPVPNFASIDGNSVATANGEEERKLNILEKELRKEVKKNLAAEVCLKGLLL